MGTGPPLAVDEQGGDVGRRDAAEPRCLADRARLISGQRLAGFGP